MKTEIRLLAAKTFSVLIIAASILHFYWVSGGTWFLSETSGYLRLVMVEGHLRSAQAIAEGNLLLSSLTIDR